MNWHISQRDDGLPPVLKNADGVEKPLGGVQSISILDYFPLGDGITDDRDALQDAVDAATALIATYTDDTGPSVQLIFSGDTHVVGGNGLDLTGIRNRKLRVIGNGTRLIGKCTDKAIIDLTNSRYVEIENLIIEGDSTSVPGYGILQSRNSGGGNADTHVFSNVQCLGHFSVAGVYNYASEEAHWFKATIWNEFSASTVNITNAVDNGSGEIRITAASHGLSTGQPIQIRSVTGTTEANGYWSPKVIDTNTFDLRGSTFVNAYSSGGTVKRIGVCYVCTADNYFDATSAFQTIPDSEAVGVQKSTNQNVFFGADLRCFGGGPCIFTNKANAVRFEGTYCSAGIGNESQAAIIVEGWRGNRVNRFCFRGIVETGSIGGSGLDYSMEINGSAEHWNVYFETHASSATTAQIHLNNVIAVDGLMIRVPLNDNIFKVSKEFREPEIEKADIRGVSRETGGNCDLTDFETFTGLLMLEQESQLVNPNNVANAILMTKARIIEIHKLDSVTIASGAIAKDGRRVAVSPESGTADDLTDITGTHFDGERMTLVGTTGNTITIKHGGANDFINSTGADISLGATDRREIEYDKTADKWFVF